MKSETTTTTTIKKSRTNKHECRPEREREREVRDHHICDLKKNLYRKLVVMMYTRVIKKNEKSKK